jgi:hypothetical protein
MNHDTYIIYYDPNAQLRIKGCLKQDVESAYRTIRAAGCSPCALLSKDAYQEAVLSLARNLYKWDKRDILTGLIHDGTITKDDADRALSNNAQGE